jgi:predicted nucleic acid-binding protein
MHEIDEATAADRRAHLNAAAGHWHVFRISVEIVSRARHPFPAEPIRTLDAIHLASALAARSIVTGVDILSLDDRIRRSAKQLGFHVRP